MGHALDAEEHRIAHVDVSRSHVDLCAHDMLAVCKLAGTHPGKKIEAFFSGTIAIRAFPA
jgi:hypothetical protein